MKRQVTLIACDICGKTNLVDQCQFIDSDWHRGNNVDICAACDQVGVFVHPDDLAEEDRQMIKRTISGWHWLASQYDWEKITK